MQIKVCSAKFTKLITIIITESVGLNSLPNLNLNIHDESAYYEIIIYTAAIKPEMIIKWWNEERPRRLVGETMGHREQFSLATTNP